MEFWAKLIVRWFGDEHGKVHGWRIGPAFAAIMLPAMALFGVFSGDWKGVLAFVVTAAAFVIVATPLFWFIDRVRQEQRESARKLGKVAAYKHVREPKTCMNGKRIAAIVGSPVLFAFCVWTVVRIVGGVWDDFASRSWPTTFGYAIQSRQRHEESATLMTAEIAYRVNGVEYVEWLDATPINESLTKEDAERLFYRYRMGVEHRVWYDPDDPSNAKLAPGPDWLRYFRKSPPMVLLAAGLIGSVIMFVKALRKPLKDAAAADAFDEEHGTASERLAA